MTTASEQRQRTEAIAEKYPQLQAAEPARPLHPNFAKLKFLIEWPVAALIFVFVAPLIGILLFIVRMTSKGDALYRQTRLWTKRQVVQHVQNPHDAAQLRAEYWRGVVRAE